MPGLLIGLGAARAGTSWLHDWLSTHPEVNLRQVKELHFFDALDLDNVEWQIAAFRRRFQQLERSLSAASGEAGMRRAMEMAELEELIEVLRSGKTERYLDLLQADSGSRLSGEITPAYALLSQERLAAMARMAPDVRFLYLMRAPVARLWSHVRFKAGRGGQGGFAARCEAMVAEWLAGGQQDIAARGDYAGFLQRTGEAIAPQRLGLFFYEELFRPETQDAICAFLGIAPHRAGAHRLVHGSPPLDLPAGLAPQIAARLAPQYAAVEAAAGGLPDAWWRERDGV